MCTAKLGGLFLDLESGVFAQAHSSKLKLGILHYMLVRVLVIGLYHYQW